MSSNEKFERDFEAFLKQEGDAELAALYRKLPRPEPDARLDAAVLAMAHRALNPQLVATPQGEKHTSAARRRARWLPALTAAATAVFAIGVAVKMGPQWSERGSSAPPAPAAARDDGVVHVRTLDEPAPPPPPASPPPPPAPASTMAMSAPRQEAVRAAPKPAVPVPQQKAAPVAEAAAPVLKPDTELGRKELEKVENVATPGAAPQAFPAAPARQPEMDAVERKQAIAEGAWQRLHDADTSNGGAATGAVARSNAHEEKKPAAPAAAVPAPEGRLQGSRSSSANATGLAAQAAPRAAAEQQAAPADAVAVTGSGVRAAPAETPAAAAPVPRAAEPKDAKLQQDKAKRETARGYSAETLRNARLYPESWVAAIQRLIRAGRRDDARENLDLFREKYPSYRLPADVERFARETR